MIRYNYQAQLRPPAPFVYVTLQNPVTGAEITDIPAQIDTAADRTVLPDTVVQSLGLPQIGAVLIAGIGGNIQSLPSYPTYIVIHNLHPQLIEAVASPGESWILLGRDMLNAFIIQLDGPKLALDIG